MNDLVTLKTIMRQETEIDTNLQAALSLAKKVLDCLNKSQVRTAISNAHVFNASSHRVQAAILGEMLKLGFTSEKEKLFREYKVPGLRPDYFLNLDGGGVLFEVERGKTLANNMDLLDVWKTHICREAKHLFLMIPQFRVQANGKSQNILNPVSNRMEAFFAADSEPIDVRSISIFAY